MALKVCRENFGALARQAIETGATEDLAALGEWCYHYGMDSWSGEYFDVSLPGEPSGKRRLTPHFEPEDGESPEDAVNWKLVGYTLD